MQHQSRQPHEVLGACLSSSLDAYSARPPWDTRPLSSCQAPASLLGCRRGRPEMVVCCDSSSGGGLPAWYSAHLHTPVLCLGHDRLEDLSLSRMPLSAKLPILGCLLLSIAACQNGGLPQACGNLPARS